MTFPPGPEKKPSSETMLQTMSLRMVGGQPLQTLRDRAYAEFGHRPNDTASAAAAQHGTSRHRLQAMECGTVRPAAVRRSLSRSARVPAQEQSPVPAGLP